MPNINGNPNANNIVGTSADDFINAKGGNDTVAGGDGNDTILAGTHNDLVYGDGGDDSLYGEDGNDTIYGGLGNDQISGGAGIDTAVFNGNANAPYNRGVWANLSTGLVTGGEGNDTLSGIENLTGSNYADFLTGNAGNNRLIANGGTDTFYATAGTDTLDGGAGGDAIDFGTTGAATANLATGIYAIPGGSGTFVGIEHLLGSSAGDNLAGDAGSNKLDGRAGNDTLSGSLGDDELWGGAGSDRLVADGGSDYVSGNYSMSDGFGDAAADTFVIGTGATRVTITDFTPGVDKLDVSAFALGTSSFWSGSAVQQGFDTVMTLQGSNSQAVTIVLQGVTEGHLLSTADMIGGNSSLIPAAPTYPINGGNGQADVFTILPQNGNVTVANFENGLDRLDISGFYNSSWEGYLSNLPDNSAVLEFFDGNGSGFTVTLTGVHYALIDPSDFIM